MVAVLAVAPVLAVVADTGAAAGGDRLRLFAPRVGESSVVFTGRAADGALVRLQRRTADGWARVAVERADRSGEFRITEPLPDRTSRYRVRSERTTSAVRAVEPPLSSEPPPEPSPEEPPADACGARPAKGDGTYWACTLSDDFDGSALDETTWTALAQAGPAGGACNVADPRTVAVADGTLRLTVRPVGDGLECPPRPDGTRNDYASGSVSTYLRWSQQYGRFEARIKVADAAAPGLQEAFWLWPDVRYDDMVWPAAGEIDIVETYSQYPDLAVPFLHYTENDNGGAIPGLNTAYCATTRGEFHTYALEWTADRVEVFVDGRSCLVNADAAASYRKRFIMTFTQLLGRAGNAYDGRAPLPATMEVDYVRVWQ